MPGWLGLKTKAQIIVTRNGWAVLHACVENQAKLRLNPFCCASKYKLTKNPGC